MAKILQTEKTEIPFSVAFPDQDRLLKATIANRDGEGLDIIKTRLIQEFGPDIGLNAFIELMLEEVPPKI